MPVEGMNHFTVLTADLEACKAFYMELLGLQEGFRPPLGFPGVWLYAGGQAVLHVIAGRPLVGDPDLLAVFDARRVKTRLMLVDDAPKIAESGLVRRIAGCPIEEPGVRAR